MKINTKSYNINIKVSGGFLIGVNHKVFKTLTFFFYNIFYKKKIIYNISAF